MNQEVEGQVASPTLVSSIALAKCLLSVLMTLYSGLSPNSRGRNASAKTHNNDSIEMEAHIAMRPLWPPLAPESISQERSCITGWGYCSRM